MPSSAEEVEAAARAGTVEESDSFDAKAEMPSARRNVDIAIDVGAMSTDGGTILYGLGEDEHERPTVLQPIVLAGQADRIGQVVATSISEVPHIEIRELPTDADPAVGYLLVIVPQSARAPHMVTVSGDHRYYGRGAKANRRLTEGEVARLYQRRADWSVSATDLLAQCVANSPIPTRSDLIYLHGFVRPVAHDPQIWTRASTAAGGPEPLRHALLAAARGVSVDLFRDGPSWRQHGSDESRLVTLQQDLAAEPQMIPYYAHVGVNIDGRGEVHSARVGQHYSPRTGPDPEGKLHVFEVEVASGTFAMLGALGKLYELAGYHGHVDIGIAVTGLKGAITSRALNPMSYIQPPEYSAETYTRTERVAAGELISNAQGVALRLVQPLAETTTARHGYDPFNPPD